MKELLALAIDRATSAIVSDINYEIGRGAVHPIRWVASPRTDYERLLRDYVETKLQLHRLRRAMYYPFDAYSEREGDFRPVLEKCKQLRMQIRDMRAGTSVAVWGEFAPEPKPSVYDKPLLYAMNEYTCSYKWDITRDEMGECPLAGEHWFKGVPYCRQHFSQTRYEVKQERRFKQYRARVRFRAEQLGGEWALAPERKEQLETLYAEAMEAAAQAAAEKRDFRY